MTVAMREAAEDDLTRAFDYYKAARPGLGVELVDEFRRAIERILQFPHGWHPLDQTYRPCTLHRFPYGIIYRIDEHREEIVVIALMHLHRDPDTWRQRI